MTRSNRRFSMFYYPFWNSFYLFWDTVVALHIAWFVLHPEQLEGCTLPGITHEAPTHTGDTPWLKIMINEVITLVTWFLYILQTRKSFLLTSAKIQNYTIKEHLLSGGPTGEIFKLISPLDPKIWHRPCFS